MMLRILQQNLIISRKAAQIAEMLPGAFQQGYLCLHNDARAAQLASGLNKARALIVPVSLVVTIPFCAPSALLGYFLMSEAYSFGQALPEVYQCIVEIERDESL